MFFWVFLRSKASWDKRKMSTWKNTSESKAETKILAKSLQLKKKSNNNIILIIHNVLVRNDPTIALSLKAIWAFKYRGRNGSVWEFCWKAISRAPSFLLSQLSALSGWNNTAQQEPSWSHWDHLLGPAWREEWGSIPHSLQGCTALKKWNPSKF